MITQCQECNVIFSARHKKYQTAQIYCKLLGLNMNLVYLCDVCQYDFLESFYMHLFPVCYTAHPHAIKVQLMVISEDICNTKILCRSNKRTFICICCIRKIDFCFSLPAH